MPKKSDIIIFLSVILIALSAFGIRAILKSEPATKVVIAENNKEVYNGSLYENKVIKLDGNVIEIKDGIVDMTEADCKNQICVEHKPISKSGESIICLPNKVMVEIK